MATVKSKQDRRRPQRTPLPWRLEPTAHNHGKTSCISAGEGFRIAVIESRAWDENAKLEHPEDRANAALIVTAVNNHERLMQLVREAVQAFSDNDGIHAVDIRDWMRSARAALAEVETGRG